jgi:hypothetical protein
VPQGVPKKIEFNLLLADLAFQIANPFASRSKIIHSLWSRARVQIRGV